MSNLQVIQLEPMETKGNAQINILGRSKPIISMDNLHLNFIILLALEFYKLTSVTYIS
jgi:hypothetical protein